MVIATAGSRMNRIDCILQACSIRRQLYDCVKKFQEYKVLQRPFVKKSIKELEEVFAQNGNDAATLENLIEELKHRTTQRALALQSKVMRVSKISLPKQPQQVPNSPKVRVEPPIKNDISKTRQAIRAVASPVTRADLGPKPEVTDAPENILRTWTALEVLSPQGYRRETDLVAGDRYKIARLDAAQLPWERGERSKPRKRLYYELMLGADAWCCGARPSRRKSSSPLCR